MLIEYSKGLLLASITITYMGEVKTIQPIDFGQIDWDINGLIGLDILVPGRFVIDLDNMQINPKPISQ